MLVFIIAVIIIGVLLFICLYKPSSPSSSYTPPESSAEPTILTGRRPRISADVSEDFYYTVQDYCRENSMTISALIRTAVESYIGSEPASATPTRSTRRSTVIMSDGSSEMSFVRESQCKLCRYLLLRRYKGLRSAETSAQKEFLYNGGRLVALPQMS